MSLFNFFKRNTSAPVARERLQVLLAHERTIVGGGGESDLVAILREEIMAVIARHVQIDQDYLQVSMERGVTMSTLEIDIQIPNKSAVPLAMAG